MGSVALIRSMVSKEGDHERGTYMMKTRLPARPDGRAPLDRRDLLPRAAGRPDRHPPAHLDPDRHSGRAGAGSSAASTTPSRSAIPSGKLPDVTSPACRRARAARVRDLEVVERAFARGRQGPRRVDAASRDARPRPRDDDLRAAQGVRRLAGARRRPLPSTATRRSAAAAWPRAG